MTTSPPPDSNRTPRPGALARLTILSGLFGLLVVFPRDAIEGAAQRVKIADVALPGIDLGLDPRGVREAVGGRLPDRPSESGPAWVPGRVLVKYASSPSFDVVTIDRGLDAETVAARLATLPDVEYAQADYIARPHYRPNDPLYDQQWNMSALRMEQAWDINDGATSSIIVAVLDSGVAYETTIYEYTGRSVSVGARRYPALGRVTVPFAAAPDLAGANRFVAPRDYIWGDDAPVDLDGHGTHVAGTIGQLTNNGVGVAGMAFNVRIMPIKVLSGDWDEIFSAPNIGTTATVATAIRYATDNGARVINMSFGFSGGGTLPCDRGGPAIRGRARRVRRRVGRERLRGRQSGGATGGDCRPDRRRDVGGRGRSGSLARVVLQPAIVGRDRGAGRRHSGGGRERRHPPADVRSGDRRLRSAVAAGERVRPTAVRRLPLRPVSRARRWRRRMWRGLPRCCMQQGLTNPAAIEAAIRRYATDRGAPGRDDDYGFGLINPRDTLRGLGLSR